MMMMIVAHPPDVVVRGVRGSGGRGQPLLPEAEQRRALRRAGPEVPGCECCLYCAARKEVGCVVRMRVTKWAKRGSVCKRVDFV